MTTKAATDGDGQPRTADGAGQTAEDGAGQPREQTVISSGELDWLLDDLVRRVAQVEKAVILSRDGLAIGASSSLRREDAEHLCAIAAGFQSLARGAGRHFGGGHARQTIVEMESAFLFVTAAGEGSCLAVLSSASADVGLVAYEMAVLVKRVGQHLSVNPRPVPADDGTK
ncbi:MAG TPA: roadblock/LC7 domain-containing protein [Streptosporangiaceae bacterium]|nr:roadblock/LC7 domain-containing protein [Streptosporangiaceae bacterium]